MLKHFIWPHIFDLSAIQMSVIQILCAFNSSNDPMKLLLFRFFWYSDVCYSDTMCNQTVISCFSLFQALLGPGQQCGRRFCHLIFFLRPNVSHSSASHCHSRGTGHVLPRQRTDKIFRPTSNGWVLPGNYSHDPKTGHSNTGIIRKPDNLKVGSTPIENRTFLSGFRMVLTSLDRFI